MEAPFLCCMCSMLYAWPGIYEARILSKSRTVVTGTVSFKSIFSFNENIRDYIQSVCYYYACPFAYWHSVFDIFQQL